MCRSCKPPKFTGQYFSLFRAEMQHSTITLYEIRVVFGTVRNVQNNFIVALVLAATISDRGSRPVEF